MNRNWVRENKETVLLVTVLVYIVCVGVYVGVHGIAVEETAWEHIRSSGILIRDDAIIESPTIMYKVSYSQFIHLVHQNSVVSSNTVFFISSSQYGNKVNRLVLIINSDIGYIYEPTSNPTFEIFLRSLIFSLPNWSPN